MREAAASILNDTRNAVATENINSTGTDPASSNSTESRSRRGVLGSIMSFGMDAHGYDSVGKVGDAFEKARLDHERRGRDRTSTTTRITTTTTTARTTTTTTTTRTWRCSNPPAASRGSFSPVLNTYLIGSKVTYTPISCASDQEIEGDAVLTCLSSGSWSGTRLYCSKIETGRTSVVRNRTPVISREQALCRSRALDPKWSTIAGIVISVTFDGFRICKCELSSAESPHGALR